MLSAQWILCPQSDPQPVNATPSIVPCLDLPALAISIFLLFPFFFAGDRHGCSPPRLAALPDSLLPVAVIIGSHISGINLSFDVGLMSFENGVQGLEPLSSISR